MRIGIDLDDTICSTTEIVQDRIEKYAKIENIDPLLVMNDEKIKQDFFNNYLNDIYLNVEVKRDVSKVIKRLRNKGNKIYIICARNNEFVPSMNNIFPTIEKWLKNNNIEVDGVITSAYGETKKDACLENKIELMIDDDPYNYKVLTRAGIKCLLFDDREKYNLEENYMTSWIEIEKYIERNR